MRRTALASVIVAALALTLRADAPLVYAIRGARIVTASTTPIENGTIILRRGSIEAVGTSVAVPPDAEVMDGKGLTIYPGLIDLGNTRVADQPPPQQPQGLRTTAEVERWKRMQILKAQARAADTLKIDDPELTKLAAAGITTVLAVPPGQVISGQSALVNVVAPPEQPQVGNIVDSRRGLVVLRTPVALHVSFPERPRPAADGYPESLMGVIAFVRQAFLDAQHEIALEGAANSRAAATAPQAERPMDDPALDAMRPALERKLPVAFEANLERQILRSLEMARELKLDPIVTGAREADAASADLKAAGARVIYSLNYPVKSKALAPDADEPLRELRERVNAPKVPAALAKSGVPFAFESAGLADAKDFVRNAARAVAGGLPEDAAIRALTIDAARIAGFGDRLGSLEKGKIANLVVTDGPLFGEKTKIVRVFIDGRPVAIESSAPTGRRAP